MAEQTQDRSRGHDADIRLAAGSPAEDRLWDDGETPLRIETMPVLHFQGFDGPMDQLLDLAKRGRIDLGRLSPLAFVGQLSRALSRLTRHLALQRRADLVILATRLMLLWSRLLLPGPPSLPDEAGEAAGRTPAPAERAAMRAAVDWLDARPQLGREVLARPGPGRSPRVAGYMALMEACIAVLEGRAGQAEDEAAYVPPVRDFWTASQASRHIRAELAGRPGGGDLASFVPAVLDGTPERALKARAAIAATLMASLEMSREGEVLLGQPFPGEPIAVRPTPAGPAASADRAILDRSASARCLREARPA